MRQLVVASRNSKKTRELQELLNGLPYQAIDLSGYPDCPEVVEDGETFEANSLKKAREVSLFTGQWTLADDSGLIVDALDGAPGVYSARYGGFKNDSERNEFLLRNLAEVPEGQRAARFVCCATLYGDGKMLLQACETCEGAILFAPHGSHGFGYDPVFQPAGMDCSMAELTPGEKHRISHRGKALAAIRIHLERLAKI